MKTVQKPARRPVKKSRVNRPKAEVSLSKLRSAITNGSALLVGCDHRSARMRRLRDLIGAHLADLGGRDLVSEAEFCLVRRAALLTLELELLESRFEENGGAKAAELESYQRVAGSLRRLHESLGLKRRAKLIGPTLGEILREGIRLDREAADAEEVA